ncbi:MAG: hypothetical protein ACLGJB_10845 [Blastocatellia bacterium]
MQRTNHINNVTGTRDMKSLMATWVRQASQEMSADTASRLIPLRPLKRLQRRLENSVSSSIDKEDLYLVFFLSAFIQDIFYNLAGEVPYSEKVEQEKQKIYSELIQILSQLANALEKGNFEEEKLACADMVYTYLSGVKFIDSALKEEG